MLEKRINAHTFNMEKTKRENFIVLGWNRGRAAYGVLADYKYTTLAGTLVFFLIMSIVPFLFWASILFSNSGIVINEILELELFGWAKDLIAFLLNNAEGATAGAGVLFLATTLWSSTGFFYHLRRSGEIIYDCRRSHHGWKVRVSAAIITFLVLLFFFFAGAIILSANLFLRAYSPWIYFPVVYSLVFVFGFFAAWILNGYVCPYRVSPNETVLGSLYTAIAWFLASAAFTVYLNFSNQERLYGALSLVIIFLLWLYWMMICFTSGVIYNRHRLEIKGLEHKKL